MSEKVNKYWFEEQQKLKKEAALQKLAPVRDVFSFNILEVLGTCQYPALDSFLRGEGGGVTKLRFSYFLGTFLLQVPPAPRRYLDGEDISGCPVLQLKVLSAQGAGCQNSANSDTRVISDCHFRKTGTEYDRKPSIKWLSCTEK
jgi:hypothetical protein